ncbi:amino acid/polyamine transporter I [Thamnocephalis sphaerospora]|uniref:Amino acid/polyamine transporter I n=1 Tax=Thamnocephalis sphaerospora TaxID=78915 RepID=A0A4P9XJV6_9FUNG|nr:amino acid/polyamine transporter I [Thamnocephalis sphaerospora]RKP06022.1 amino acid/polyamine transporter I [Thamnocephalis sphaerospora]|eukprot:RKP04694.1 amino acid/polyamine transporter I [Thamnocephalis sphaerospora]
MDTVPMEEGQVKGQPDWDSTKSGYSAAESPEDNTVIKPTIGVASGISIIMGTLISAEGFLFPGTVWQLTGSIGMSFIMWAIGAFFNYLGGLCYTELGTMLPQSGGDLVYINHFYRRPRQLVGYLCILAIPASMAAQLVVFGEYIMYAAVGEEMYSEEKMHEYEWISRGIGAAGLALILLLNITSMNWVNRVHTGLAVLKILIMLFIIIVGIVAAAGGLDIPNPGNWDDPFAGTSDNPYSYAQAFLRVNWALTGWATLNYTISEVKRPERTLPISIFSSLTIATILILLLNAAYSFVVPADAAFAAQELIAGSFGTIAMGEKVGQVLVSVLLAIVGFGSASVNFFSCSRVLHESARLKYMPGARYLSLVHGKSNTPRHSLVVLAVLTLIVLVAPPPGRVFNFFIELTSFSGYVFGILVIAGLIVYRFTNPNEPRPFRAWLPVPIIFILSYLFTVVCLFLPPDENTESHLDGDTPYYLPPILSIAVTLVGLPFWYVYVICGGSWRKAFQWRSAN